MTTTTRKPKTDAAKIAAIAARHEAGGWQFVPDYSGRCFRGRKCPAIICPPCAVEEVEAAVRRAGIRSAASGDSMGRDSIVYWTAVAFDQFTSIPD
jgi:hypothetical protein